MRLFRKTGPQAGEQVGGGDPVDTPRGPAKISDWRENPKPPRIYVRLDANNEYVGFSASELKLRVSL